MGVQYLQVATEAVSVKFDGWSADNLIVQQILYLAGAQVKGVAVAQELRLVEEFRGELLDVRRVLQAVVPSLLDGVEQAVRMVKSPPLSASTYLRCMHAICTPLLPNLNSNFTECDRSNAGMQREGVPAASG